MTVQSRQTQENLQNPPLLTSIGNVGGIQPIRMEETFQPYEDEFGLIGHMLLIFYDFFSYSRFCYRNIHFIKKCLKTIRLPRC
jgi:hypothetical protein